jgi:multiple sugar transport system substrate-binding protein
MKTFLKLAAGAAVVAAGVWLLFFAGAGPEDRLRVCFWGAFEEWEMWQRIGEAFERRHPAIRVKLEYYPGAQYADKVRVMLASGKPTDVILFQDEPFPPFCEFGKFEDLTPYLAREGGAPDLDRDYWPTAVASFRWRGRTYGIPVWGGDNLIYINKDQFDRLGAPYPEPDWTVDDFLRTCQALTRDVEGDGRIDYYGFTPPYWLYWLPFLHAFGARVLEADGPFPIEAARARWALVGAEAVAAARFAQDLVWKHHVAPREGEAGQVGQNVLFLTGRVAMFTSGPWEMPFLNRTDLRWDVVHVPRGPGGRGTRVTWDALVMAADSTRKDQAWTFIRFAAGREAQEIVARTQRSVPALVAVKDLFVEARPNREVHVERFIEGMAYARMQPITDQWEKMATPVSQEFGMLLRDPALTPEEVLERLAKRQRAVFPDRKEGP